MFRSLFHTDSSIVLFISTRDANTVEEAGLLSFAANNLDVLINMFGFIAVEPAKIAIPAVSASMMIQSLTRTMPNQYIN